MKLARFAADGNLQEGQLTADGFLTSSSGKTYDPDQVVWLPPVIPTKVIGLALNFADHADELKMESPPEPALFFKPLSSLVGHRANVIYPEGIEYMHYEVELAVVIGRRCRRVPREHVDQVIAGYTIANDITVRDYVGNFYRPPVRAKGYDTFGPVGPCLVTPDEIPDPASLDLRAYVNGELRQQGNTANMLRTVPELIEHISMIMTLEPGDMIWCGTPKGISHVYPGDMLRLEIDGMPGLENHIISEDLNG
jgi:5-oxopent-3-ene-1,2,5-tricarboxylate decarboxylase / 2-hydroxyhepta-2,4-diene-1,7-dioate isomerase